MTKELYQIDLLSEEINSDISELSKQIPSKALDFSKKEDVEEFFGEEY